MEFEEALSNLRAIRLLYRLLQDNNLQLQNDEYSEDLIERARGLLKNLLDVAVASVFHTHLKIIATQTRISKASLDQEKHMAVPQSNSPSSTKYPTSSKMISQMDEKSQLKLISEIEVPDSMSDNGGTKIQPLNNHCEENSMLQHDLVKATTLPNENGISPNSESSHSEQQHNHVDTIDGVGAHAEESLQMVEAKVGDSNEDKNTPLRGRIHEFQINSSAVGHVESPDQKGDFSDDLLNSMKRIESRVFALQLCSNLVDSPKTNAGDQLTQKVANLDSAIIQRKDETSGIQENRLMNQQKGQPSCNVENVISTNSFQEPFVVGKVTYQNHRLHNTNAISAKRNDTPKQIGTQLVSRGEFKIQNRIQSLNRVKSLNKLVIGNTQLGSEASDYIQVNLTNRPTKLSSQTKRKKVVRKNSAAWSKAYQNQKERSLESSYTQKQPVRPTASSTISRRQKLPPPHQMVIRPTLLDQRSSEIKVFSHHNREGSVLDRRGTHKSGHFEPNWKTTVQPLQHHQEQEESSSNYHSSSSWNSQQGSGNSSSENEDYSLPSSNSHSSTSGTMVDDAAAYEGSLEESTNNSSSYTSNDDNPSDRIGSIESHRYYPKRNPGKTSGGLRKLKNKLGLIFHHHHHHHHHYDDSDDNDNGSIYSRRGHKHSMWNDLQNVFHHKNNHGVLTTKRKVFDKTRRGGGGAVARVMPQRNQVGQFHRLAEGLMRHMQHSKKKQKPHHKLGEEKDSGNNTHGYSKKKKLHWWQMLRQRRGVKVKNRGRVKVGFISHKSLKN